MQEINPYSPPSAQVKPVSPTGAGRVAFPWLFVLRWILGLAIVLQGAYGLYGLVHSWDVMASKAIIDPGYAPYRYLPGALLKLVTGVAILLRSKWSVPLSLAWTVAFAYMVMSNVQWKYLPPMFFFSITEQLSIVAFLCFLFFRGRLR